LRRLACLVLAGLAACGTGEPVAPAEPEAPEAPVVPAPDPGETLAIPRGRNLHQASTVTFESLPEAPHRLLVTYQGAELCRWSLKRLGDEDADRRVEYRSGSRAFLLPQDSQDSLEYGGDELALVLRRMELRRVVLVDELDSLGWDAEGRLELADGLGWIEREQLEDEAVAYTAFGPSSRPEETLTVTAWEPLAGVRRPVELELRFGDARIWRERLEPPQLQSWFKQRYFWPPDRADEAPEQP
jgi:hypothetical protein